MNFDFTDDQRAIKETARDLLAKRFKLERLRELAESKTYADDAWSEVSELGWPGIFIAEENGGQGLGARTLWHRSDPVSGREAREQRGRSDVARRQRGQHL